LVASGDQVGAARNALTPTGDSERKIRPSSPTMLTANRSRPLRRVSPMQARRLPSGRQTGSRPQLVLPTRRTPRPSGRIVKTRKRPPLAWT
jgi:hypothetical protein